MHSIASGVLITALFLFFFREIYSFDFAMPFLLVMTLSFVIFFSVNAHQRFHNQKTKFQRDLTLLLEGLHYFVIGVFFAEIVELSFIETLLSAIPILLLKFVLAYEKYNHHQTESKSEKYLMEISTVLGFVIALSISVHELFFQSALAIVAGGIFYSVISLIFTRVDVDPKIMIAGALSYGMLFFIPVII